MVEGAKRAGFLRVVNGVISSILFVAILLFSTAVPSLAAPGESAETKEVISKYLAATEASRTAMPQDTAVELDIDASVPKLKKQGKLQVLRKISDLGKITYKQLSFQGDDTIKNEVIARYLEAEQKGQADSGKLAITPENYKFKYKGLHTLQDGRRVHIVFLSPRKKTVGLFKGEMWLDADTYLPVMETGKLVKNPSIFFKKVEFVRNFTIQNGTAIPQVMQSIIDARLIGKVNLSVRYLGAPKGSGTPAAAGNQGSDARGATTASTI